MAFMDTPAKRQQSFWYFGAGLLLLALLTFGASKTIIDAGADDDPPATTVPAGTCGVNQVFFARETSGNQFGPAANEADVEAAHTEFASRRCRDAMLFVADEESLFDEFTDAPTRVQKTIDLMENPDEWARRELRFQNRLNEARREIAVMEGRYQTMDAEDKGRMIPEVYQIPVEAAPFKVIRYTFPDGTVKQFKLNCGYQPVEQNFPPSVPGKGAPPAPNQPSRPVTPGRHGQPVTPVTTPEAPTTTWKCTAELMADGVCGSGGNNHPSHVDTEPLPPTPDYVPGNAEDSAADPADGVIIPPGGNMSPGDTNGTTGGNTGFDNPEPTEATPQPVNEPGDPGAPA